MLISENIGKLFFVRLSVKKKGRKENEQITDCEFYCIFQNVPTFLESGL